MAIPILFFHGCRECRPELCSFDLELRETDAAVRAIGETPVFALSDLGDCGPLIACRNLIRAEHTQFFAANNALPGILNLLSYDFDLRF